MPTSTMSAQRLSSRLPAGFDIPVAVMLCAGDLFMFAPTFRDLAVTIWSRDEQGHGPIP